MADDILQAIRDAFLAETTKADALAAAFTAVGDQLLAATSKPGLDVDALKAEVSDIATKMQTHADGLGAAMSAEMDKLNPPAAPAPVTAPPAPVTPVTPVPLTPSASTDTSTSAQVLAPPAVGTTPPFPTAS